MEELSSEEIQKTIKSLVDITQCAVCLEIVNKDMVLCVNGHFICSECREDLEECPTCRADFSHIKPPPVVSQIIEALPRRCKYKNCGKFLKTGDDHEMYCGLKPTQCKLENCEWQGPGQSIKEHIQTRHPDQTVYKESDIGSHTIVLTEFDPDEDRTVFLAHSIQGEMDLAKCLWDIALCAICLEIISKNMVQCVNGHLICSECREDLVKCPTCRGEFSSQKPLPVVTQIIEAFPSRCSNS